MTSGRYKSATTFFPQESGACQRSMSSLLAALGVDDSEFVWQDIASCRSVDDPELFFGRYEDDRTIAENVDAMCLSCPVARQCLQYGIENESYGVWGGIYLSKGDTDQHRNSHKTQEVWEKVGRVHA